MDKDKLSRVNEKLMRVLAKECGNNAQELLSATGALHLQLINISVESISKQPEADRLALAKLIIAQAEYTKVNLESFVKRAYSTITDNIEEEKQ